MERCAVAHCDARELLERIEPSAAALVYFDPPAGTVASDRERADLNALYLQATCHAKRILDDRGVLVWHVLSEYETDVRRCLDRVLGSDRLVTGIVLKRRLRPRISHGPIADHTFLYVFSKTEKFTYVEPRRPLPEERRRLYSKHDRDGEYRLLQLTTTVALPSLQFAWKGYTPPEGKAWRYSGRQLEKLHGAGRIEIGPTGVPHEKDYLREDATEVIGSVWDDMDLPAAERVPGGHVGQQPLALMHRIVAMVSEPDDLVVDPFCGTGTTLIAAELLGRRWLGSDVSDADCAQTVARLKGVAGADFDVLARGDVQRLPVQADLVELIRELPHAEVRSDSPTYLLLTSPESLTLERKRGLMPGERGSKRRAADRGPLKTIVAFLNTRGGTLLIGVTDDNEPLGVDDEIAHHHRNSEDEYLLFFKNVVRDKIGGNFLTYIQYQLEPIGNRKVLRVDCSPSDTPCFLDDNDFYVRVNPSSEKLGGSKMWDYIKSRFGDAGASDHRPLGVSS